MIQVQKIEQAVDVLSDPDADAVHDKARASILEAVSRLKDKAPTDEEIERIAKSEAPALAHISANELKAHRDGIERGLRYARDNYSIPSPSVDGWISVKEQKPEPDEEVEASCLEMLNECKPEAGSMTYLGKFLPEYATHWRRPKNIHL